MALGVALTFVLDNAKDAFNLLLSIGAGTGLIYLLRWFWWRINAWSEVSAMIASFGVGARVLRRRAHRARRCFDDRAADDDRHYDGGLARRYVSHAAGR